MASRLLALVVLTAGGLVLRNQMKKNSGPGRLSSVTETIDVNVPVSTAYNQWTQFEDFPKFMAGVHEVRQLDDTHLRWRADVGGKEERWDSEITEQVPDRMIAWRSTSGAPNEGRVRFERISDDRTRIELRIDYQPRGMVEQLGDAVGAVSMRAKGNLERFKQFLESRGGETGAWRGRVSQGQEVSEATSSQT
jgi:uncharacterized membrane protein